MNVLETARDILKRKIQYSESPGELSKDNMPLPYDSNSLFIKLIGNTTDGSNGPSLKKHATSKQNVIRLLNNHERRCMMNNFLSNIIKPIFDHIREMILNMDLLHISSEFVEAVINIAPNADELSAIKDYIDKGDDVECLDIPEQFVASLIGIPLLQERLDTYYAALIYKEKYSDIESDIHCITNACEAVTNSKRFKALTDAILRYFNQIKHPSLPYRGYLWLHPSILKTIAEHRTATIPSKTILGYVVEELVKTDEDNTKVYLDFSYCDRASQIDLKAVRENLVKLPDTFAKIKPFLDKTKDNEDPLASEISRVLVQWEQSIEKLSKKFDQAINKFKELCKFLNYKEDEIEKLTPKDVFGTLWTFACDVIMASASKG